MIEMMSDWISCVIAMVGVFVATVVFGKIPPGIAIGYVGPAAAILAVLKLLGFLDRLPW